MIQFLGLDFSDNTVSAACIGKDLSLTAEKASPILNVRCDPTQTVTTVTPAEWIRAACYVVQEIYLDLPVSLRKVWGLGLSAPAGWVALDFEFKPLGDLRFMAPEAIREDFRAWIDANPRLAKRISAWLSPKDYFRFVISGALATDITSPSRQRLLRDCDAVWDEARLENAQLNPIWMPPAFDCEARTAQISEEGMKKTGLPGGIWIVAGGLSASCARVAAGDLREGKLWAPPDAERLVFGTTGTRGDTIEVPEGFVLHRSAYTGYVELERRIDTAGERDAEDAARIAVADLKRAGHAVDEVVCTEGRPAEGAAAFAAIGSGLVKSWDALYRGWKK